MAIAASHPTFDADEGEGVVIQPMIAGGVETMIGITDDPLFGPLVAFGLGGIHVEVLRDVLFRIAPLTDRDADAVLRGVRGFKLLQGYRGHPPADLESLRELLLRVSRLAEEVPEIAELDLNPVIALPPGKGCRIVDARIRVSSRRSAAREPQVHRQPRPREVSLCCWKSFWRLSSATWRPGSAYSRSSSSTGSDAGGTA
jgi:acyl-CoA synthetase (NDP forming)